MEDLQKKITSIIIACAALFVIWHFHSDRFNVGLIKSPESCKETLTKTEETVLDLFEKRAHTIISGTDGGINQPTEGTPDIDLTKPSLESIQKLLNTDALVNVALSRVRKSVADNQTKNPESLINKEKKQIHTLFETARSLCDKIPSFSKKQNEETPAETTTNVKEISKEEVVEVKKEEKPAVKKTVKHIKKPQ